MSEPPATRDRVGQAVWLVYEDDTAHGIQSIVGIYSNMEAAEHVKAALEGRDIVIENWPVEDGR